jgi:hypothetical protein
MVDADLTLAGNNITYACRGLRDDLIHPGDRRCLCPGGKEAVN